MEDNSSQKENTSWKIVGTRATEETGPFEAWAPIGSTKTRYAMVEHYKNGILLERRFYHYNVTKDMEDYQRAFMAIMDIQPLCNL